MNDLNLPPRRSMPPAVRDRVRGRLDTDRGETPSVGRLRIPLAAAAGVAVLASAAIVVTQSVANRPAPKPPATATVTPPPGLDVAKANEELDRCWAAVRAEHVEERFPPRETWVPVLHTEASYSPELHVTGAIAEGKPLFCQTTATRVTVTDPTATPGYAEGSRTGSLLVSDVGVVAGVVDPSWPALFVEDVGVERAEGLFLTTTGLNYDSMDRDLIVSPEKTFDSGPLGKPGPGELVLPRPTPPAVAITDRPPDAKPDRDSPRGRLLGACFAGTQSHVTDPDVWQPGALVEANGSQVLMARGPDGVGRCTHHVSAEHGTEFYDFFDEQLTYLPASVDRPTVPPLYASLGENAWVAVGALPESAASLRLTLGNGDTVDADVAVGTFAAPLPPGVAGEKGEPTSAGRITSARVLDANGSVIYEGPVTVAS